MEDFYSGGVDGTSKNFPGTINNPKSLHIPSSTFIMQVKVGSNTNWGYKIIISPITQYSVASELRDAQFPISEIVDTGISINSLKVADFTSITE